MKIHTSITATTAIAAFVILGLSLASLTAQEAAPASDAGALSK